MRLATSPLHPNWAIGGDRLNILCYAITGCCEQSLSLDVASSQRRAAGPTRPGRTDESDRWWNTIHPLATAAFFSSIRQCPAATTSQAGVLRESFGDAGALEHPALA
jgi:hypothetical protein